MSRNQERQLQRLLLVEPRVAVGGVVQAQVLVVKPLASTGTFCDRIARKLQVHAAQERTMLLVDFQRRGELGEDVVEGASLDAGRGAAGVSVHVSFELRVKRWLPYPCMGSHCQTTMCPLLLTASMCPPSIDSTLSAP